MRRSATTILTSTNMPINIPNSFCSQCQVKEKQTIVSENEFDSIGQIDKVDGTPCKEN